MVSSFFAHKLRYIHMNNQEKLTTRLSKLKVHRANSHAISSYPFRFSSDILFSSLDFDFLVFFLFICFSLMKKYIFWYTFDYAGRWMIKKISPGRCLEARLLFWPSITNAMFFLLDIIKIVSDQSAVIFMYHLAIFL